MPVMGAVHCITSGNRINANALYPGSLLAEEEIQALKVPNVRSTGLKPADQKWSRFSHGELTPFSERGSAVLLEDIAAVETAVLVEVVVDRGMDGGEFLQGIYPRSTPLLRECTTSRAIAIVAPLELELQLGNPVPGLGPFVVGL